MSRKTGRIRAHPTFVCPPPTIDFPQYSVFVLVLRTLLFILVRRKSQIYWSSLPTVVPSSSVLSVLSVSPACPAFFLLAFTNKERAVVTHLGHMAWPQREKLPSNPPHRSFPAVRGRTPFLPCRALRTCRPAACRAYKSSLPTNNSSTTLASLSTSCLLLLW